MTVGLVAVWSCDRPLLRPLVIPQTGVTTLGRDTFPADQLLAMRHIDVEYHPPGLLRIFDRSDGNTFIDGHACDDEPSVVEPRQLVRIGDTLLVAVPELAKYSGCRATTLYGLDVRVSLRTPCDQLAKAILEETNVAIAGPRWVTHMMARGYLDARGGGAELDVTDRTRSLAMALDEAGTRTVRLESPNALLPTEFRTLRNWLETDVRFVCCIREAHDINAVPAEIRRWLAPLVIEIPTLRFDELPVTIDAVRRFSAPHVELRASLVEDFLLGCWDVTEDLMFHSLADRLRGVVATGATELSKLVFDLRKKRTTFRMTSYPIDEG